VCIPASIEAFENPQSWLVRLAIQPTRFSEAVHLLGLWLRGVALIDVYVPMLVFAGRPGGPEFYISTVNNVANHGPGK
jgi:hypothetical protein